MNTAKMITSVAGWINSYAGNNNTGTIYEISVGLSILLGAGFATPDELPDEYKDIKPYKAYNGLIGIFNVTQLDSVGGTGDIGILSNDNILRYYSITKWTRKISKCICNPTGKKYGLERKDALVLRNEHAFNMALDYRKENYGQDPNKKWKRRPKCPGAKFMCEYLASEGSISFNSLDIETRKQFLIELLDLNPNLTPNTEGIVYWNHRTKQIEKMFKWKLIIDLEKYLDTYSDGIYIYHGTKTDYLLKTQCKYNNGIIEGMPSKVPEEEWKPRKSTSYLSSWNCVANKLDKIFELTEVKLTE
jgi:hypothetical protein